MTVFFGSIISKQCRRVRAVENAGISELAGPEIWKSAIGLSIFLVSSRSYFCSQHSLKKSASNWISAILLTLQLKVHVVWTIRDVTLFNFKSYI
jgi:hypothetical protein